MMFDADLASDARLQRSRGQARLRFEAADGLTRVAERYAASPARLLVPNTTSSAPEVVLANTSGGVAGGDAMAVEVTVGPGADATVSGQAAEKIYRAIDLPARLTTTLKLEAGARLEWLPQETILFDGALLERDIAVSLAPDAHLLMSEMVVFGRKSHGESFDKGLFFDKWRIDLEGRPLWRDAFRLEGGGASMQAMAGLRGARALATVIYAGPDAASHVEPLREMIGATNAFGGATARDGLLLARLLAPEAGRLKHDLTEIIGAFRAHLFGRPATAPRVWLC